MDLLKKHYEKIILGVVLVGLAAAVAWLPFKIASDKQTLEKNPQCLIYPKVKPLTNLDLTIRKRSQTGGKPAPVNFSEPNKLFNPMLWQKRSDEQLIRADKAGPPRRWSQTSFRCSSASLSTRSPLPEAEPRYIIGVQNEAATTAAGRRKKQTYSTLNSPRPRRSRLWKPKAKGIKSN
jgi:hypothetical protein